MRDNTLLQSVEEKLAEILSRYPDIKKKINQVKAERPQEDSNG